MYQGAYTLVGNELSLFSRKLEAQLRFQQIPWHWLFKTQERAPELEARAGTQIGRHRPDDVRGVRQERM
jgi:hypothetical protein